MCLCNGLTPIFVIVKQCIAIILFICVSCQLVAKLGIVAWWEANRSYVAKELCENRNQPQKKCAGKCYLKKQLNKIEQEPGTENNIPNKKHLTEVIDCILTQPINSTSSIVFEPIQKSLSTYVNHYQYKVLKRIFHPPAC